MQRLLGFIFILLLFSSLTTSVQAENTGAEGAPMEAPCNDLCEDGFVCDEETNECVEDENEAVPVMPCESDEDCMDGYWCNLPQVENPAGAEPAEETGEEPVAPPQGACVPIDDETGGGDEVGAETTGGEETGGEETGGDTDEGGSSDSGGCSMSSPSDVDRGLVLLLALAAAFALLFPRAERRGRSL